MSSASSPGRNSSRHINDLKSLLQASLEPNGNCCHFTPHHASGCLTSTLPSIVVYTRAQFLREERNLLHKTNRVQGEVTQTSSPVAPATSPFRGRPSLIPTSPTITPSRGENFCFSSESSFCTFHREFYQASGIRCHNPPFW